jgi:hypothetical protein
MVTRSKSSTTRNTGYMASLTSHTSAPPQEHTLKPCQYQRQQEVGIVQHRSGEHKRKHVKRKTKAQHAPPPPLPRVRQSNMPGVSISRVFVLCTTCQTSTGTTTTSHHASPTLLTRMYGCSTGCYEVQHGDDSSIMMREQNVPNHQRFPSLLTNPTIPLPMQPVSLAPPHLSRPSHPPPCMCPQL